MKNCCLLILFYFLMNIMKGFSQEILELNCNVNSDCNHFKGPEYNTTCLDGQCLCNNLNGERTACKPQNNKLNNFIGGTCPCTKPHSICNHAQSICYCETEYIPSSDRRRCIKKNLVLGEKCEDDSQCLGLDRFAECHLEKKKCVCQKNFIDHSGICVSTVGLKNRCLDDLQCLNNTANSLCQKNTCTCQKGYTASLDLLKCLPFADYKEACKEDNQCKYKLGAGSECYMEECACDYRHFVFEVEESNGEKHQICERKIVYGDYCIDHNDCYQYHLHAKQQSMECFFGECGCRPGFINVNGDCVVNGAQSSTKAFQIMALISLLISALLQYN